jgi:hypothetical protein
MMKIVKVVSVIDTREYEEQGDSFVPIPGSGNPNVCGRCTREHEIHWTVLLEGGQEAVVGGSCAKSGSLDRKLVSSAERFASREKKLSKELATYESRLSELERVIAEVAALPKPPFVMGEKTLSSGEKIPVLSMDDGGEVWCQIEGRTPERERLATQGWESKRIGERTQVKENVYQLRELVKITKKGLDAVRKSLAETVGTALCERES